MVNELVILYIWKLVNDIYLCRIPTCIRYKLMIVIINIIPNLKRHVSLAFSCNMNRVYTCLCISYVVTISAVNGKLTIIELVKLS